MTKTRFILSVLALWLGSAGVWAQPVFLGNLHKFTNSPDGSFPGAILLGADNALYGVTFLGGDTNLPSYDQSGRGGTIFKINRDGSGYKVLHSFFFSETGDHDNPDISPGFNFGLSLIQGSDSALYGTTRMGTNGYGLVFKCNTDGNAFAILHNFTSADSHPLSLLQGKDGALYGTAEGTIFKLDTQGSNYAVLHTLSTDDGQFPIGSLLQGTDGVLYGTTQLFGTNSQGDDGGTIFRINTNGNFAVLHSFPATNGDGNEPVAGLIQGSDGALYGTTFYGGGARKDGAIFKLNPDGNGYQVLYAFANGDASASDGINPYCKLVQGVGNVLYGTTAGGVNNDLNGTIFKIGTDGNGYNVLDTVSLPFAGLVSGPSTGNSGILYGTFAGATGAGEVFSLLINPPVSITPMTSQTAGNQTVVYWPAWAFNYVLQTTTNLTSPTWVTVSNAVPVAAVQVTNTAPTAYFRLIYQ